MRTATFGTFGVEHPSRTIQITRAFYPLSYSSSMRFPSDLHTAKKYLYKDQMFQSGVERQCESLYLATENFYRKKKTRLNRSINYLNALDHCQNKTSQGTCQSIECISKMYKKFQLELGSVLKATTNVDDVEFYLKTSRQHSLQLGISLDQANQTIQKEIACIRSHGRIITRLPAAFLHLFQYLTTYDIQQCRVVSHSWLKQLTCHCVLSRSILTARHRQLYWNAPTQVTIDLSEDISTPFDQVIELEVLRTTFFPRESMNLTAPVCRLGVHSSSSETLTDLQRKLCQMLKLYARTHPHTGYGHGMTFLGSTLLSALDYNIDLTYCVFTTMMKRLDMQSLWHGSHTSFGSGLSMRLHQLSRCIHHYIPSLAKLLSRHDISTDMFACSWILSLFLNEKSLPPRISMDILNLFLCHGWESMFQLYLGLLVMHTRQLEMENDFCTILKSLLALPSALRYGLHPYLLCGSELNAPSLPEFLQDCQVEDQLHP